MPRAKKDEPRVSLTPSLEEIQSALEAYALDPADVYPDDFGERIRKAGPRAPFTEYMKLRPWRTVMSKEQPKSPEAMARIIHENIGVSDTTPINLGEGTWIFKGFTYSVSGPYSDEELRLLVLDAFDKERRDFERLRHKYASGSEDLISPTRLRIPENVRIEVWRRDGGKCAHCESRESLEYDHIIPVPRGGSSTARNIELLCEGCNRSKGSQIQ